MKDAWQSGDPYEYFMGRWSNLVAEPFIDWLASPVELKWLDVGCGSGALSEAIINKCNPVEVIAIDQSDGFVKTAQKRLGNKARCRVGNALSLPLNDASVNNSVSGLVLNFVPEPSKLLSEMKRVTCDGGKVGVYIWDYAGKMEFLNQFWDAAVELDTKASSLHEGSRFPGSNAEGLEQLFNQAGFKKITVTPIDINTDFKNFDDYWSPFLGGQGPAPSYVTTLDEAEREKLRNSLYERLPLKEDGRIPMVARAWAAKGIV
jgi:ubiquinone/menaquinone biosynthesis C-methylase UbiE